mmetsp:Transcript_30254/g.29749  ORF Transcript_30254/g.29749 Transcript_30254/m.29749 type:complete len:94 (+) Transcript_30254:100-381(+)
MRRNRRELFRENTRTWREFRDHFVKRYYDRHAPQPSVVKVSIGQIEKICCQFEYQNNQYEYCKSRVLTRNENSGEVKQTRISHDFDVANHHSH